MVDEILYLKWFPRSQIIHLDAEKKTDKVKPITNWPYPKSLPIGKKPIRKIEDYISTHYTK